MTAITTREALVERGSEEPQQEENRVYQVSCEVCFFGASQLCSLPKGEACPTFRPKWLKPLAGSARR